MINSSFIRRLLGLYDSNGLKHSAAHLKKVKNDIPLWPLKRQAKYADAVTVCHVNELWLWDQIQSHSVNDWWVHKDVSTTTVGNLAYAAIHSISYFVRIHAAEMLFNYGQAVRKGYGINSFYSSTNTNNMQKEKDATPISEEQVTSQGITDPSPTPINEPMAPHPVQLELSFGNRAVGLRSITAIETVREATPEDFWNLQFMKTQVASVIDVLNKRRATTKGEAGRYFSKAISYLEDAVLNVEKGLLWPYQQ